MGTRLKALWAKIEASLQSAVLRVWSLFNSLSTGTKAFIVLVISALAVAKYRDVLIQLIVDNSKKILNKSTAKDAKMAAIETADVKKANDLEAQADALVAKKPVVDENWNK